MDDRPEDLYLLDAEQAARELLLYGMGNSETGIEQLVATANYLSSLLLSLTRHDLANVALELSRSLPSFDEGKGRRAVRELGEIVLAEAEQMRHGAHEKQSGWSENHDRLEKLALRLQDQRHLSNTYEGSLDHQEGVLQADTQGPDNGGGAVLQGQGAESNKDLIADAFKAIQAVDSLATMISLSVGGGSTPSQGVRQQGMNGDRQGLGAQRLEVDQLAPTAGKPSEEQRQLPDPNRPIRFKTDSVEQELASKGASLELARPFSEAPADGLRPENVEPEFPAKPSRRRRKTSAREAPAAAGSTTPPSTARSSQRSLSEREELAARALVSTSDVDHAFLQALRFIGEVQSSPSAMSLLEAIDQIDHLPLESVLPAELKLLGGVAPKVHHELASALGRELARCGVAGVVDATLSSHTLVLTIHLDRMLAAGSVAGCVGFHGGRIETDGVTRQWRIVLPSSTRLMRVVPLKFEGSWIAIPWAHFLGVDGSAEALEARLLIGDEEERLRVTELGAASIAIRYELLQHLRRRDRYRGVVATASSEVLPLFG